MSKSRFYELTHPGGPKGLLTEKPVERKQDDIAQPVEMYAVVFFPRLDRLGPAAIYPRVWETLARTPEAAIAKFLDSLVPGEKWETYADAGHRVRKVIIADRGDAEGNPPLRPFDEIAP